MNLCNNDLTSHQIQEEFESFWRKSVPSLTTHPHSHHFPSEMSISATNSVADPLCIILVKNGSKGDRLLFRYPFTRPSEDVIGRNWMKKEPPSPNREILSPLRKEGTPFFEETPNTTTTTTSPSTISVFSPPIEPSPASASVSVVSSRGGGGGGGSSGPLEGDAMLRDLSEKDLSNLLAVGNDLSERKFELKLNFLRFVGHPTLMYVPHPYYKPNLQSSVKLFHVVFCLNAVASHSIVKCFHDLSKRLGVALRHEEMRCGYLTEEFRNMVNLHDELCPADHCEDNERFLYQEILIKSKLAQLLKQVYEDVVTTGHTFVRVNGWVQISFCLPQKIHKLQFREQGQLVDPEAIHRCLEAIRPYHSILLLVEEEELCQGLIMDSSSTIGMLLQVFSPLKSLQTMAADADLTLSQVMEIVSHLVYWAQACVIYPLCESNIYAVAENVPTDSAEMAADFEMKFGESLARILEEWSSPMPLGERFSPIISGNYLQSQQLALVMWLLKHRVIVHLHTYVYLTAYYDNIPENPSSPVDSMFVRNRFLSNDDLDISSEGGTSTGDQDNVDSSKQQINAFEETFSQLSDALKRAVATVKTPLSVQDIKLFARLSKYFNGGYHLEEIMYQENIRRSQLMLIIDKFSEVLVCVEKEDSEINFFSK